MEYTYIHMPFFRPVLQLHNTRRGQSLVEVLVAMVVGVIFVMGAVSIIAPTVRGGAAVSHAQVAITLGKELLDNVRVYGEHDWHNVLGLATSSDSDRSEKIFHLNTTSSPFTSATGTEVLVLGTSTYSRYFYLSEVQRNYAMKGQPIVLSGGTVDPSTRKIGVVYGVSGGATSTISTYITRTVGARVFIQTDWSAGPGQDGPVTSTNNLFATSTNMNATGTPGSIEINI